MKHLRARAIGFAFFGLLTLGQAYPFAQAWAMGKDTHPCCCSSEIAKPCDCDHSGHSKKFSCHQKKSVGYQPAPCGTKTETQSLNFRGENCLPRFAALMIANVEEQPVADLSILLPQVSAVPEPPPPRG